MYHNRSNPLTQENGRPCTIYAMFTATEGRILKTQAKSLVHAIEIFHQKFKPPLSATYEVIVEGAKRHVYSEQQFQQTQLIRSGATDRDVKKRMRDR